MSRISIANSQVPHEVLGQGRVRLHASAVMVNGEGVLILGAPNAGKSAYAAYLIQAGAMLIADDQVVCTQGDAACYMAPPSNIAGVMAVRGLGLIKQPYETNVMIRKVMVLTPDMLHGAQQLRILGQDVVCEYGRLPTGAYYIAHGLFAAAKHDGRMLAEDWMPKVA